MTIWLMVFGWFMFGLLNSVALFYALRYIGMKDKELINKYLTQYFFFGPCGTIFILCGIVVAVVQMIIEHVTNKVTGE